MQTTEQNQITFTMTPIKVICGRFQYREGRTKEYKFFEIDVTSRIDKMSPSDLELFIIGALTQMYPEKMAKIVKNSLWTDHDTETRYMADNGEVFKNITQRVIQC